MSPIEPGPSFLDTNTLVYIASDDIAKARISQALITQGGWISVQVLNELARVLRGKLRYGWPAIAATLAEVRGAFKLTPITLEIHDRGLELAERYQLAIFDSMIVAAALESGCATLYSEDMHHGLVVDGVLTVINPFRDLD